MDLEYTNIHIQRLEKLSLSVWAVWGTPIIPIIPSAESYRIHLMFGPGIHGLGGHSRYWKLKGMGFAHVRGYLGSS